MFYCNGSSTSKSDPRTILGSVLRQLYIQSDIRSVRRHFKEIFQLQRDNGQPFLDIVLFTAKKLSESLHTVYCIIDGVDECEQYDVLLKKLLGFASGRIKVLVTSRRLREIETLLLDTPQIVISEQSTKHDIREYITWRFSTDSKLKMQDTAKEEIVHKLGNASGGMYSTPAHE
jgi:hypothetical protein